ncbi:MAG: hypothetical protein JO096_11520 [Alphaproteobacteria bacterium]|nr:hypothetical protein [Alphaproteobacteria bacterium]
MKRVVWVIIAMIAVCPAAAQQSGSGNPAHDRLMGLPPAQQAKALAKGVGHGCVGISAFPMGVASTDKWKSIAYWSVKCKDGRSFAVQIAPNSEAFIIDCRVLQANGKECFKKF